MNYSKYDYGEIDSFLSIYTVKGGSKTSYTVKSLKKGKTYYVAVRPYVNKGGHRYDGVSSEPKKVKIK